ncbi:hypothetical protein KKG41_06030 [Patescibacteria group bacterium]|nr:hypothetical protein [Patescibacteria group bacterium]MBU1890164.1 hypothetical protein [Patescibacteria group bacterium]
MSTQFSNQKTEQPSRKIHNKIFYPLIVIANIGLIAWLLYYLASVFELITGIHLWKGADADNAFWGVVPFVIILIIFLGLNVYLFSLRNAGNLKKFLFITLAIGVIEILFIVT